MVTSIMNYNKKTLHKGGPKILKKIKFRICNPKTIGKLHFEL